MATPSDTGTMPLRPALRPEEPPLSPKSGPAKVVSIAEPEEISLHTPDDPTRVKQFPTSTANKRMTGRPYMPSNTSSRLSLVSTTSMEEYPSSDAVGNLHGSRADEGKHHKQHPHSHDKLLSQVAEWLQSEKAKRAARKSNKRSSTAQKPILTEEADGNTTLRPRTSSHSSNASTLSLERLQSILEDNMSSFGHETLPITSTSPKAKRPSINPGAMSPSLLPRRSSQGRPGRRSSVKRPTSGLISSDTEFGQDGEGVVNSCDAVLDNSKTMSYGGGAAESSSSSETTTLRTSKREEKERTAWLSFKTEILKITHTLELKHWRKIPLECGGDIEVKRLSGALTNAVYVVSPPPEIPAPLVDPNRTYRLPRKLLLRVYGPQVEHLIDRENELGILRRLARKKIGPRLLGTFENGRFEEYFESTTLTAEDLRVEATSKQIAKRMRELHEGIDLLEREVEEGPFVWLNWDKWVDRCEEVISYLDKQILSGKKGRELWRERGLVCGVEWPTFKAAIDRYRRWLDQYYATRGGVNSRLVFAHNDTQYGNILRITPEGKPGAAPSPLLLPENTHRQLVVIDFEYASANTPGLEFANHFTEWCYNYHNSTKPWSCDTDRYPTLEEQRRFIRSYVNHRPQFNPRASATPKLAAMDGLGKGNSISDFLLDSRNPGGIGGSDYAEEEKQREAESERQVEELLKEVKIWRVANSAQWVAWGIVQAKVPELDGKKPGVDKAEEPSIIEKGLNGVNSALQRVHLRENKRPEGLKAEALLQGDSAQEAEQLDDEEDEFDYLAYAQDRAMFFWGDVVSLGIMKKEELPESLVQSMKFVEY
ncbi:Choline kinase [Hyphodiscus hymeniophilus]|uniref:Choline kinase n=1 Tax=Hyphodiscus hymeniophilus TaxID=353542 RepID=A0A9P7B058_9HELO|nr:Choline kinase [Hyphodiscus hymeniophilus]